MINVVPQGAGSVDVVLTNIFTGYQIPGGIADLVAPRVPTGTQTGRYIIANTDDGLNVPAQTLRATGTPAQEVSLSEPGYGNFNLQSRALKTPVADEDQRSYKLGDLMTNAQNTNAQRIMTERESRVASLLQNPANYAVPNTLALNGNSQIDNAASDPVQLAEMARQQVSLYADVNTAIISNNVFSALRTNPTLRKAYTGVAPQIGLSEEQVAAALGVAKVIVAKPVQAIAGVRQRIWKNTMLFCYLQSSDAGFTYLDPMTGISSLSPLDASLAKTFVWTNAPATINGYGVQTWRDPDLSKKTSWVSNDCYMQEYITSQNSGFLFTSCLANNN